LPLDLKAIESNRENATVVLQGEKVWVEWKPLVAARARWVEDMTDAQDLGPGNIDPDTGKELYAEVFLPGMAEILTDWDITSDGERIPPSLELFQSPNFPDDFLRTIFFEITQRTDSGKALQRLLSRLPQGTRKKSRTGSP
jgi:hypothetical protein